jgi:hypothetical protein
MTLAADEGQRVGTLVHSAMWSRSKHVWFSDENILYRGCPMKPPPHRRRPEPYYKVQYRDNVTLAWMDHRKEAFDTFQEALGYLQDVTGREPLRIVEFNAGRSKTVYE